MKIGLYWTREWDEKEEDSETHLPNSKPNSLNPNILQLNPPQILCPYRNNCQLTLSSIQDNPNSIKSNNTHIQLNQPIQ